jgi:hypothetical protein
MQGSPSPAHLQQGGVRSFAIDEIKTMSGYFILIGLILASVYVSRIPSETVAMFNSTLVQFLGLAAVVGITVQYGWIHGILAALVFALIVSRAVRQKKEGFSNITVDYVPLGANTLIIEDPESIVVPENHKWFVEKVMGENPFIIREKNVKTNAVQDMSERSMGSSTVTK